METDSSDTNSNVSTEDMTSYTNSSNSKPCCSRDCSHYCDHKILSSSKGSLNLRDILKQQQQNAFDRRERAGQEYDKKKHASKSISISSFIDFNFNDSETSKKTNKSSNTSYESFIVETKRTKYYRINDNNSSVEKRRCNLSDQHTTCGIYQGNQTKNGKERGFDLLQIEKLNRKKLENQVNQNRLSSDTNAFRENESDIYSDDSSTSESSITDFAGIVPAKKLSTNEDFATNCTQQSPSKKKLQFKLDPSTCSSVKDSFETTIDSRNNQKYSESTFATYSSSICFEQFSQSNDENLRTDVTISVTDPTKSDSKRSRSGVKVNFDTKPTQSSETEHIESTVIGNDRIYTKSGGIVPFKSAPNLRVQLEIGSNNQLRNYSSDTKSSILKQNKSNSRMYSVNDNQIERPVSLAEAKTIGEKYSKDDTDIDESMSDIALLCPCSSTVSLIKKNSLKRDLQSNFSEKLQILTEETWKHTSIASRKIEIEYFRKPYFSQIIHNTNYRPQKVIIDNVESTNEKQSTKSHHQPSSAVHQIRISYAKIGDSQTCKEFKSEIKIDNDQITEESKTTDKTQAMEHIALDAKVIDDRAAHLWDVSLKISVSTDLLVDELPDIPNLDDTCLTDLLDDNAQLPDMAQLLENQLPDISDQLDDHKFSSVIDLMHCQKTVPDGATVGEVQKTEGITEAAAVKLKDCCKELTRCNFATRVLRRRSVEVSESVPNEGISSIVEELLNILDIIYPTEDGSDEDTCQEEKPKKYKPKRLKYRCNNKRRKKKSELSSISPEKVYEWRKKYYGNIRNKFELKDKGAVNPGKVKTKPSKTISDSDDHGWDATSSSDNIWNQKEQYGGYKSCKQKDNEKEKTGRYELRLIKINSKEQKLDDREQEPRKNTSKPSQVENDSNYSNKNFVQKGKQKKQFAIYKTKSSKSNQSKYKGKRKSGKYVDRPKISKIKNDNNWSDTSDEDCEGKVYCKHKGKVLIYKAKPRKRSQLKDESRKKDKKCIRNKTKLQSKKPQKIRKDKATSSKVASDIDSGCNNCCEDDCEKDCCQRATHKGKRKPENFKIKPSKRMKHGNDRSYSSREMKPVCRNPWKLAHLDREHHRDDVLNKRKKKLHKNLKLQAGGSDRIAAGFTGRRVENIKVTKISDVLETQVSGISDDLSEETDPYLSDLSNENITLLGVVEFDNDFNEKFPGIADLYDDKLPDLRDILEETFPRFTDLMNADIAVLPSISELFGESKKSAQVIDNTKSPDTTPSKDDIECCTCEVTEYDEFFFSRTPWGSTLDQATVGILRAISLFAPNLFDRLAIQREDTQDIDDDDDTGLRTFIQKSIDFLSRQLLGPTITESFLQLFEGIHYLMTAIYGPNMPYESSSSCQKRRKHYKNEKV